MTLTSRLLLRLLAVALVVLAAGCGPQLTKEQQEALDLHLDQGMLYFQYGQMTRAKDQFERVNAIDPDHLGALVAGGLASTALGQFEDGSEALLHAREIEPEAGMTHLAIGMLYFEWARRERNKAREIARLAQSYGDPRLPGADPTRAKAFEAEAQTHARLAKSRLETAREALLTAEGLLRVEGKERAEERGEQYLDSGYLLQMLALVHASLGPEQFPKALGYLDRYIANAKALRVEYKAGMESNRPKMNDADLTVAKEILAGLERSELKARLFAAFLHYEYTAVLETNDKIDFHQRQALAQLNEAKTLNPDSLNILLNEALIFSERGDYGEAKARLEQYVGANVRADPRLVQRVMEGIRRDGDLTPDPPREPSGAAPPPSTFGYRD